VHLSEGGEGGAQQGQIVHLFEGGAQQKHIAYLSEGGVHEKHIQSYLNIVGVGVGFVGFPPISPFTPADKRNHPFLGAYSVFALPIRSATMQCCG